MARCSRSNAAWTAAGSFLPAGDEPARLRTFARELGELYLGLCPELGLPRAPRPVVEPGRAIAGNAAIVLCRVHAIKGRWVYLDLTRNWVPESSLLYARALLPAREPATRSRRLCHLSGPTLNSMDVLDVLRLLPAELCAGDAVALCDAGAYTIARANRYACEAPRAYMLAAQGELRRPLPQAVPAPPRARVATSPRGRA